MNSPKILLSVFVILLSASFLAAANPEDSKEPRAGGSNGERVTGQIEKINLRTQSLSVRVGDATTTFSFDNKTVFTYGDHSANAGDLKIGNEVFVRAMKGKAAEVNGTQRIEGIIERIDTEREKLIVKIGDRIKEIPFLLFTVATPDGQAASVHNMKVGDSVLLNVNLGLPDKTKQKK